MTYFQSPSNSYYTPEASKSTCQILVQKIPDLHPAPSSLTWDKNRETHLLAQDFILDPKLWPWKEFAYKYWYDDDSVNVDVMTVNYTNHVFSHLKSWVLYSHSLVLDHSLQSNILWHSEDKQESWGLVTALNLETTS